MTAIVQRVALYGRFSGEKQNPLSARDQLSQCAAKATANGWIIIERFSDEAISGAVRMRPAYQALRHVVVDGAVDIVMAESLDRLSRDQEETSNLYKLCQFHEVRIFTLSEGFISELHVGLSSTINAVYLKQLKEKTRRGLGGRIENGMSAGGRAYGYRVVCGLNGLPKTGELEIHADEAAIIRRIFTEYADGHSPRAIAAALNAEHIPAPQGRDGASRGSGQWRANTINGNRQRGTGIINNELYVGRRVWGRLRYLTAPGEKKRISRLNPENEWIIKEVPHLRIVDDALWSRVKSRQCQLTAAQNAKDNADKNHLSGAHATKRPTYLLSGLIRCGYCGGTMNIAGSHPKRYFCANKREKGAAVCPGIPGIGQSVLERMVLEGLRNRLMQPEAVAKFIDAYRRHSESLQSNQRDVEARLSRTLRDVENSIANVMAAIRAGIFTSSTKAELENLEQQKATINDQLRSNRETIPSLPANLADVYRDKVENLVSNLNDPSIRLQATEALRALVEKIIVGWDAEAKSHTVEIVGELAALLSLGANKNAAAYEAAACSLKLVAGARNTRFLRLVERTIPKLAA